MIQFDYSGAKNFMAPGAMQDLQPRVLAAHDALLGGTGAGSEFLGWRALLAAPDASLLDSIAETAAQIRSEADVFLCIGIGGSYLGARAVIDALQPYFDRSGPEILFAGHHMSGAYQRDLLGHLQGKAVHVNVISKSGTTLEPALAFRFARTWLETRGADVAQQIVVTTDPSRGALNRLRDRFGFRKFEIPPSVGGRFSVLTPVGLLPIAVAGIDIHALFGGAADACQRLEDPEANPALDYAAVRFVLQSAGYTTELMAAFEPKLGGIAAWWQQLFGESEGKDGKGIFPVGVDYSTDLHSIGQYVQDGRRTMLETFLLLDDDGGDLPVPAADDDADGLAYLAGQTMQHINRKAFEGTARAHQQGGVPVLTLTLPAAEPAPLGDAIYFFEHAIAVSGYLQDLNPFDQPGVEAYKKEMFRLLGKPGV